MDPTQNLKDQIVVAERILRDDKIGADGASPADAVALASLVLDLRNWIANGGFVPDQMACKRVHLILGPTQKVL